MRNVVGALVAAAAVALLTAGLATGSPDATKGTLTIAVSADPGNLDPQLSVLAVTRGLNNLTYDTLVHVVGPGQIQSGLASSWQVLSPTKVRFTLARGITCANGAPLTAGTVARNIQFVGDPKNKSPLLGVFVPPNPTVQANNRARTITITTAQPNPFPVQGYGLVQIICQRGLNDRSLLVHGTDGTGPYRLVQAVSGDHYTYAVRKDYHWGPKGATTAPLPAKVVYRIVPNETTAANLLLTHAINIATIIGPDRSRLNKAKLFKRVLAASPNDFWFNENSGHPAANASIRRALVQALNLKQIGSVITAGRGVPVTSLTSQAFSPCAGNSVTGSVPSYNPSAASGPLSSHPSIKVLYTPAISSTTTAAMELLQQQLSAAGAKVTLSAATTTDISAALFGTGNWDLAFVPVTVATPSQLVGFVSGPTPPNGANFGGINNAAYSKLVASAVTKTGAAACKDWLSAESALMRNADVAPANVETTATFGSRATFALDVAGILPTSLRLTK